jgi:serine/threonine protein kinase
LLLHGLNHENIIKVKDFFKLKSGKFLSVMEYQEGYDLGKIVADPETIMEENEKFAN